jgi:hypothetical protein
VNSLGSYLHEAEEGSGGRFLRRFGEAEALDCT